jgi:hypothetical protein
MSTASDAAATGQRETCSTMAGSKGSSSVSSTSYGVGSTSAASTGVPLTTPTTTTGIAPGVHPGGGTPIVASTIRTGRPPSTVAMSPLIAANRSPRSPGRNEAALAAPAVTAGSSPVHPLPGGEASAFSTRRRSLPVSL